MSTDPAQRDPRSYQAAVEHAVVHEAEYIVERVESGPTPMQRFTRRLFESLSSDGEEA